MADLVASTIGVLLKKTVSVAADRINLVLGFRKDLEAMQEHAKDIYTVLADADAKQSRNPRVLRWLRKVEAAATEADYALDELLYESLRQKVESRDKVKRATKVCLFFSLSKHDLSFRWRMGSKVREINRKFENFKLEAPEIGLIRMEDSMCKAEVVIAGRQTNSLPLQFVAGRDVEVSDIVGKLLSASSKASASVSVLSIVGMGGLGKTTLAKSIYNNPGIDSHFGHKIWVCVSHNFHVTELFRLILESLEGGKIEYSSQDTIVQKIQEKLASKMFLLVLDDVWNIENQMLWNDFFDSLVGLSSTKGSCCLVTTRLQKTAKLVSTFDPFVLGKLAEDECWYIICRRATKDEEMPQELDAYREQVLEKCQGLPLAANVVGGLLSLQRRNNWISIVENKILTISNDVEGEVMPILKLSFDNLPLSVKKCFAYCSIYSKDAKISGNELIGLWMAEGFLQEDVERRTVMEEIGEDHLTVLLQSSLLEKVDKKLWWHEDAYQMHDLVHDLAEFVSKREQIDGEVRHIILESDYKDFNARSTLIRIMKGVISDKVLLRFQRVRILCLCGRKTENLPNAIGKAKHLRYLDVSFTEIKFLPDALCKLYNLQTLKLGHNFSLECLPHGLSNLISLRHLYFFPGDMKFKMPPNMGKLTCLQTLYFFSVGEENGYEIKELGSMKNLACTIRITNLEFVKGEEEARLAKLFEKKLVNLNLCWGSTDRGDNNDFNDEHVLEGLEPQTELRGLGLNNFMGDRLPRWFGQLKLLNVLKFNNCARFKDLPTLGHLPYLKDLEIKGLENVTCITESFYTEGLWEGRVVFPSLKTVELRNLPNLSEWKGLEAVNGPVFPKLESLVISDCCQLASVPFPFPSLQVLEIKGNVRVSVVRDIIGKGASLLKKLRLLSMAGLTSLTDVIENHFTCLEVFHIAGCSNLIDLPSSTFEVICASLEVLMVEGCPKLMPCALNLQQTPSLSSLCLSECPNLLSTNVMPTGFRFLTNLSSLRIGPFTDDSVQSFDWSGLIACSSTLIRLIWFGSLGIHSCMPQQLQHLTSLRYLHLHSLKSVKALPDWLGSLTSLQELELSDCPMLERLPSAHAMGRLVNLRELEIRSCPLLPESLGISSTLPSLKISRR